MSEAAALHDRGIACLRQGRIEEAIGLLREAAAAGPASYLNDLAVALNLAGRKQEAVEACRRAVASDPAGAPQRRNLGRLLLEAGKAEEALGVLREAVALDAKSAEGHAALGSALVRLGHQAEAAEALDAALSLKPYDAGVLESLGTLYGEIGRLEDALKCFERLVAIRPAGAYSYHAVIGWTLSKLGRLPEAAHAFETALRFKPDFAEVLEILGETYGTMERSADALRCFERLAALQPGSSTTHVNCGKALARLGRYGEAAAAFSKALALDPRDGQAAVHLGTTLAAEGWFEEALATFERAAAENPEDPEAQTGLGDTLHMLGRIDEAIRAYERAVALAPRLPQHLRRLLGLKKHVRASDPAVAALEALAAEEAGLPDNDRAEIHFALGKVYGDLGRPGESYEHFVRGNACKRRTIVYDEAAELNAMRLMAEKFPAEAMRAKAGLGDPSQVPVFVVGMPRSGTTLVEQILASHPKVFGAGELLDFGDTAGRLLGRDLTAFDLGKLTGSELKRLGADYLKRVVPRAPEAARIVDKMTVNFRLAGLIHLALPRARIIHVRRDAMDTCFSCYCRIFWGNINFAYDLGELGRYYRAYEALMAHWRRVLPPETFLDVEYEALVADLEPEARRLIAFCGLEWEPRCLEFHKTQRPVRTASAAQVREPLYGDAVDRWKPYAEWLGPLREALQG